MKISIPTLKVDIVGDIKGDFKAKYDSLIAGLETRATAITNLSTAGVRVLTTEEAITHGKASDVFERMADLGLACAKIWHRCDGYFVGEIVGRSQSRRDYSGRLLADQLERPLAAVAVCAEWFRIRWMNFYRDVFIAAWFCPDAVDALLVKSTAVFMSGYDIVDINVDMNEIVCAPDRMH